MCDSSRCQVCGGAIVRDFVFEDEYVEILINVIDIDQCLIPTFV